MTDADSFQDALAECGAATLASLQLGEWAQRHLAPESLDPLRTQGLPIGERLLAALPRLRDAVCPDGLEPLREDLLAGAEKALRAMQGFVAPDPSRAVEEVLGAMREHARAQEALYPLRAVFPAFGRYFAESPRWDSLSSLDPDPAPGASVGLHRAGADPDGRGGFVLYVPEWYTPDRHWPLVVALHGGMGHGGGFVWTWLREARSRGALLLAPTSQGDTWSLHQPALDAGALRRMVAFVQERWAVDSARVLLTGLSDGATFTLLAGLEQDAPYTALAPISGVLHPLNFACGNMERARERRIYLAHGARDWMFPIALAHAARDALQDAGARLEWREVEDLSHAYPREENARILEWLDPALALPPQSSG